MLLYRSPLKIVRGMKQYLYDDNNIEFLDCVNSTAHVGHCHPQVESRTGSKNSSEEVETYTGGKQIPENTDRVVS